MPPRLGLLRRLSHSLVSNPSPSQSQASLSLPFRTPASTSSNTTCQCRLQHGAAASQAPAEPQNDKEEEKRRKVHLWLKGPGAVFKDPKPGSTNYINAYSNQGVLIRSKEGGKDTDAETLEDLRPFPLNPTFVSESVLSEDLRNEIHRQVVEYGKSLREVSVMHGVDLKRVAAVVRLVELEKKWVAEVCIIFIIIVIHFHSVGFTLFAPLSPEFPTPSYLVMMSKQIRLVLKTPKFPFWRMFTSKFKLQLSESNPSIIYNFVERPGYIAC